VRRSFDSLCSLRMTMCLNRKRRAAIRQRAFFTLLVVDGNCTVFFDGDGHTVLNIVQKFLAQNLIRAVHQLGNGDFRGLGSSYHRYPSRADPDEKNDSFP